MSEAASNAVEKDAPKLSLLDQLKQQHAAFVQQKDIAQNNLNQLVGAIYACELMIKKHQAEAAQELSQEKPGETNGEADKQEQEQAA